MWPFGSRTQPAMLIKNVHSAIKVLEQEEFKELADLKEMMGYLNQQNIELSAMATGCLPSKNWEGFSSQLRWRSSVYISLSKLLKGRTELAAKAENMVMRTEKLLPDLGKLGEIQARVAAAGGAEAEAYKTSADTLKAAIASIMTTITKELEVIATIETEQQGIQKQVKELKKSLGDSQTFLNQSHADYDLPMDASLSFLSKIRTGLNMIPQSDIPKAIQSVGLIGLSCGFKGAPVSNAQAEVTGFLNRFQNLGELKKLADTFYALLSSHKKDADQFFNSLINHLGQETGSFNDLQSQCDKERNELILARDALQKIKDDSRLK